MHIKEEKNCLAKFNVFSKRYLVYLVNGILYYYTFEFKQNI
jgi:hypothetical protein